ncbi:ABC transporter permease [Streptomyces sp. RPT161]|uniref:ABC transporter permease n=1 Tax=Streptomyces sp. RPT161 TaxID=3015993 RepID=UPI0022B8CBF9|nr:ABC transporter permease [Streptomyces sp. RPT161]
MRNQIAAETLKVRYSRSLLWLLGIGTFFVVVSNLGLMSQGRGRVVAGTSTAAVLTHDLVRNPFAYLLFVSMAGAMAVSGEYQNGYISRSVLLSGGRNRLLAAKAIVSCGVGALFGALAVVVGVATSYGALSSIGRSPVFDRETWLILGGVFLVNVLAGPWGTFLGWLVRHQVASVSLVFVMTMMVDPALQRLLPSVGKYLMTIAMSSVYRDDKTGLLSEPIALVVIAAWLAVAAVAARKLLASRDIT